MTRASAKPTLIFDFDGTIADSFTPTMEILATDYRKWGDRFNKRVTIGTLRSLPIHEIVHTIPGGWWKFIYLLAKAKRYIKAHATQIQAYPGIVYTIRTLHDRGYPLLIVTSNQTNSVRDFLMRFNLEDLFEKIVPTKGLFRKAKVLKKLLRQRRLTGKKDAFYIGDEIRDIEACHKIGLPIISVSYGFNSYEGLKKYRPQHLLKKPTQLLQLLRSLEVSEHPTN